MSLQEQLQKLLLSLLQLLFLLLNPVVLISVIIIIAVLIKKNKVKKNQEYESSAYYQITRLPYGLLKHDLGKYGEYLIYKHLKSFEDSGAKFLFNIYIPKGNGETTEIDVLMIFSKGVFVFESKNYSGWIFGSEGRKNWYQTLPTGRGKSHKEYFYNPIMQNRSHMRWLKAYLGEQIPIWSIIVFSDRCTLKSIQITSNDICVINRCNVASAVSAMCNQMPGGFLNESKIAHLYGKLYPCTQVDAMVKAQHIANIHNNRNPLSLPQTEPSAVIFAESIESITTQRQTETSANISNDTAVSSAGITIPGKPGEQRGEEKQILKCPKCGGNLVLRIATRGANIGNQFYGCSNYPTCKYIQNITKETV